MTLHYNTICQNEKNAVYPHKSTINSIVDLETVVSYDHVCAEYKDGYRKNSNFILIAVCLMWITPKRTTQMNGLHRSM